MWLYNAFKLSIVVVFKNRYHKRSNAKSTNSAFKESWAGAKYKELRLYKSGSLLVFVPLIPCVA